MNQIVASNVRRLRKLRRLTLRELVGVFQGLGMPIRDNGQLSKREMGQTRITVDELSVYATAFGVPVASLLEVPTSHCDTCQDATPVGFTCNACGAGTP